LKLPSELSRAFGIEADEIILKAMAARPLDRFATVEAFRQAVVSLQASLLSRPQDSGPVLPAAALPQAHPSLEITSDPVSIHNPDEDFEEPGTGTLRTPGTGGMPAGGGEPWLREGVPDAEGPRGGGQVASPFPARARDPSAASPAGSGRSAGAGTAHPDAAEPAEEGRILSAFAQLGDKSLEEAHSKRRFAHGAGPLAGADPRDRAAAEAADAESGEAAFPGDDAAPVPAWLWILIALAGSCLVVLSAYFGFRGH
jgi:hypothetical protein